MNKEQLERMHSAPGFIAALDQSGGSTPKALAAYGISEENYHNEEEMFTLVHNMRKRIITSPSFTSEKVIAAILFEQTMEREVENQFTADYLWNIKGIVPFLKIDRGLAEEKNHVRLMKEIPHLDELLEHAYLQRHIFGTKERSLILDFDEQGIKDVVAQQFDIAKKVCAHGLVPIIEPEIDIHSPRKAECEKFLLQKCLEYLAKLPAEAKVIFKLTLPEEENLYIPLMNDSHTVRVVALSGGYSQEEANQRLAKNNGIVASFSRALAQDLRYQQSQEEFDKTLANAIDEIYQASIK